MQTKVSAVLGKDLQKLARDALGGLGDLKPQLAVVFASVHQPLEAVLHELAPLLPGVVVLGASSAGEFTQDEEQKGSISLTIVGGDISVHAGMGAGLADDYEAAVTKAASGLPPIPAGKHRTAILLLDPLSGRSEEATVVAGAILGPTVALAGGAAGDDLQLKKTVVGCGTTAASDAVVLAVIDADERLGVGAAHGHRPLSGPLTVTSAKGATVHKIDGRPAWDVWAEQCKEAAGIDPSSLAGADVGAFLLRFEAGLRTRAEYKLRAPLSKGDDGSLSFACGMPEGTVFQIMRSEPEWQLDSAKLAADRARAQVDTATQKVSGAIVFDCICRNLILGDRFYGAVKAISEHLGNVPIGGFETYGEIALDAGELTGFHNTTSVVLAFPTARGAT